MARIPTGLLDLDTARPTNVSTGSSRITTMEVVVGTTSTVLGTTNDNPHPHHPATVAEGIEWKTTTDPTGDTTTTTTITTTTTAIATRTLPIRVLI